jgi:osmotically inducible lipoprotein OsmB
MNNLNTRNTMQKYALIAVAAGTLLGLSGCSGMSTQDKNTAIGAGVGAVGGAVLTGGSTVGTVGGAAVGGVIGHEVNTDKR